MSITDVLLNGRILFAILVFLTASIAVEIIGAKIIVFFEGVNVTQWILERLLLPLARAATIMIFIVLCYPLIFGIHVAPPLLNLLTAGSHRISTLLNILFILPLLFSLIPVIGRVTAFILPVQTIAGSTLVFSWMQATLSAEYIQYTPQWPVFLIIVLFAILSHWLARWVAAELATRVNRCFNISDGQKITYRMVIIVTQLPVVLTYTTALGAQL